MAATIMPKPSSLYKQITADNQHLNFTLSDAFYWSADTQTIHHPTINELDDVLLLLHELAHANLGHQGFNRDVELIVMEREAWQLVGNQLAPKYNLELLMEDDIVQDALDSYRHWLHSRSICPDCSAVGLETSSRLYRCLVCQTSWRTNDARTCELRRYKVKHP